MPVESPGSTGETQVNRQSAPEIREAIAGISALHRRHRAIFRMFSRGPHLAIFRNEMTTTLPSIVRLTKTLGHSGRLRILAMLHGGPLSVCQIAAVLSAPPSTVSGHLLDLRREDLVAEERRGKWVYYRIAGGGAIGPVLAPLLALMAGDPQVARDTHAAASLRGTPPDALCAADAVGPGRAPRQRSARADERRTAGGPS
jgi:DNA-binding transcriptional ArsR family regulator